MTPDADRPFDHAQGRRLELLRLYAGDLDRAREAEAWVTGGNADPEGEERLERLIAAINAEPSETACGNAPGAESGRAIRSGPAPTLATTTGENSARMAIAPECTPAYDLETPMLAERSGQDDGLELPAFLRRVRP